MKISVQLELLPGASSADRARWGVDHGVEGIELTLFSEDALSQMRPTAEDINGILPITSVCGNLTPSGDRGFEFLSPDPAMRRAAIDGSKAILDFCGDVGAVGQIVPPIFGAPNVPDVPAGKTPLECADELMVAACEEIGPYAAARKTLFMLEPLNRYEQQYLCRQAHGVRIIEAAKVDGIGLLSDFFHMNIEETDTPGAFREYGRYTSHIHLADNTRLEPGTGDIDFVAAFKTLLDVGYDGYMAYECGISGESQEEKTANLAGSIAYVRDCVSKAIGNSAVLAPSRG
ncbi:MAG: sugar phosphate isomerase/epimerase [Verrucomicrobia bacterium]|nr:sugar phosphate isomerase/epimerase [Verrucomicrobiota bacterium]MDA1085451.1 sugar phosphate isomerase/epimerase [Verrucomicrobiota bacterium]